MNVNYNNFAKTFSESRKNMKWEELEYFFGCIDNKEDILDIGCGSGRLLEQYKEYFGKLPEVYMGVDLSEGLLEEAKKSFPKQEFKQGNMLDIECITGGKRFENIFLIASFHHLDTIEKRENVLTQLQKLLTPTGKIYITNWALESPINKDKYKDYYLEGSKSKFGSKDFNIRFGENDRYYHSFSLTELEYLAQKTGYQIIENRLFDSERNIITIFKK